MKKIFLIVSVCVLIAGCSVRIFAPIESQLPAMQEKVPEITFEGAQKGYQRYSQKCAGCHQLYEPGKFTFAQWNTVLPKMFPKAKIKDSETQDLIRNYVQALSK